MGLVKRLVSGPVPDAPCFLVLLGIASGAGLRCRGRRQTVVGQVVTRRTMVSMR